MNRNVGIATAVGIIIIIGVISFQIYNSTYQRSSVDEYYSNNDKNNANIKHVVYPANPQTLHGLTVTKDKYLLGENVFFKVQNIPMGLKDSLDIFSPGGVRYMSMPFDGDEKSNWKHYFRPSLLKQIGLCDKEQIIGEWTMMFRGLPDEKLVFQVVSETLPGSEEYYVTCKQKPLIFPTIEPSLND